jgi:hypothetical protein
MTFGVRSSALTRLDRISSAALGRCSANRLPGAPFTTCAGPAADLLMQAVERTVEGRQWSVDVAQGVDDGVA